MNMISNIKCKNPNCNNTFELFKSEMGRKLYCSRVCRSKYHWSKISMCEKTCKNPNCNITIKRKFKSQINKVYYCSLKCKKNHKVELFKNSLNDTIESICRCCKTILITKRQKCGKLIPRKICNLCNRNENIDKAKKMTEKFIELYKNEDFRNKMNLIYKENGKKAVQKHKKFGLSKKWINWYRNQLLTGKSKLENKVYDYLKLKFKCEIERWYPISNIFVDFYIPSKNLIIECQGDYWHMNPDLFKYKDYNKSTKKTAKQQWKRDKNRKIFLEKSGYNVIELWETEINRDNYEKLNNYIV